MKPDLTCAKDELQRFTPAADSTATETQGSCFPEFWDTETQVASSLLCDYLGEALERRKPTKSQVGTGMEGFLLGRWSSTGRQRSFGLINSP